MSNRKAEVLIKYLSNLSHLGYTKEDEKVKFIIKEIEGELNLLPSETNEVPKDKNKALLIVVKDTSGSMNKWENLVTKEYYELALQGIKNTYKDVEELFISHTTEAKLTSKDDLFNTQNSGGTFASSGLRETLDLLNTDREVIIIQFSDGDNLTSDNSRCIKLLVDEILPKVKYFKYVEANQYNRFSTILQGSDNYKSIEKDKFSYYVINVKDDALKGLRLIDEINLIKN
ncbi:hypothetical protein CHH83_01745 [Bacillus sp. 7586-K]|nr:hypothetical protein CHH83_01745 [Bacillus sp. 7586-K]